MKRSSQNWKKIVVVVLSVCVLVLIGLAPMQATAWRTATRSSTAAVDQGGGSRMVSAIVASLLTLVLGFILAWLLAWIVQLRVRKTTPGAIWGHILIGAGIVALLLLGLLLSPLVDLTALRSSDGSRALQMTLTQIAQLPTHTPYPTYTSAPTYTPAPTHTTAPTYTAEPTYTPVPTWTPFPTATPSRTPTATRIPTASPTNTMVVLTRTSAPTLTQVAQRATEPIIATLTGTPAIAGLPVTGTTPRQVVRVLLVVALAALLIGGGIWEVRRQRQK